MLKGYVHTATDPFCVREVDLLNLERIGGRSPHLKPEDDPDVFTYYLDYNNIISFLFIQPVAVLCLSHSKSKSFYDECHVKLL